MQKTYLIQSDENRVFRANSKKIFLYSDNSAFDNVLKESNLKPMGRLDKQAYDKLLIM